MPSKLWIITRIICAVGVCCAIYRDIGLLDYQPKDLRYRMAGASLQKNGYIPYDYKWSKGDEKKYFDSQGDYALEISGITTSPFFHFLLYPITGFKDTSVIRIWTMAQYMMILLATFTCYKFADTAIQKGIVIFACTLFLFTEAWVNSIALGQLYVVISFLFAAFTFCLKQKKTFYNFGAGICASCVILIRPNAIFMFLPFLSLLKINSIRQILFFLIAPVLFLLFSVTSGHQRNLWISYGLAVSGHLKAHQTAYFLPESSTPAIKENTGNVDLSDKRILYSENGNFFVVVKKITGIRVSPQLLISITFVSVFILFMLFLRRNAVSNTSLYIYAIQGACLYMVADLLSPIYRHQYYTVQWIFPLLLAVSGYQRKYLLIYLSLGVGLFLNIINTPLIKMEHTLGEYIWLIALLILSFVYKPLEPALEPDLNNKTTSK